MDIRDKSSQTYSRGLQQLRISELLLEEALAKQQTQEVIESLELRTAAIAYEREGLMLLGEAMQEYRTEGDSGGGALVEDDGRGDGSRSGGGEVY